MVNSSISNFGWLKELIAIEECDWYSSRVKRTEDVENYAFYDSEPSESEEIIDPRKIVGISYCYDYNSSSEITWIELLNSLKRFHKIRSNFHSEEQLVTHSNADFSGDYRCLHKYGDEYFTVNGQHRVTLSKFLGLQSIKVKVREFKINQSKFEQYQNKMELVNLLLENRMIDKRIHIELSQPRLPGFIAFQIMSTRVVVGCKNYTNLIKVLNEFQMTWLEKNQIIFGLVKPSFKSIHIYNEEEFNRYYKELRKLIGLYQSIES